MCSLSLHTHTHTLSLTHSLSHSLTHTHTHTHTYIQYIHTYHHINMSTHKHTHYLTTHHAHTHNKTHTHTHTNTHRTLSVTHIFFFLFCRWTHRCDLSLPLTFCSSTTLYFCSTRLHLLNQR